MVSLGDRTTALVKIANAQLPTMQRSTETRRLEGHRYQLRSPGTMERIQLWKYDGGITYLLS